MNNISWLLYFSNLSENIKGACIFGIILLVIITVWSLLVNVPGVGSNWEKEERETKYKIFKKTSTVCVSCMLLLVTLYAVLPSKNTVLMIAASEATEKVVVSEQGKLLINTLEKAIRDKLKG